MDEVAIVPCEYWSRIPRSVRNAILDGVTEIERVRDDIRGSAQVPVMPIVRVVNELWFSPELNAVSQGRATFFRINGSDIAGVELPASTAVCENPDVIRAILLHEFAHSFYYLTEIVNAVDAGKTAPIVADERDLAYDEAHDRARLADPADWFCPDDVRIFPYWGDPRLAATEERTVELDLVTHLPVRSAIHGWKTERIGIDERIVAHIRRLRGQR